MADTDAGFADDGLEAGETSSQTDGGIDAPDGLEAGETSSQTDGGIDAPITGVTVFTDGARVVRTGRVTVEAGLRPVLIASLPESADPASVRVAARGAGLGLLNVEVQRRVGTEPRRTPVAELRADVEHWRDTVRQFDDEDAAEQAGLGFLGHLAEAAATSLARAVSAGRAGYDELSGMAGHLSASTANTLARRREIAARKRAAQRELEAAVGRLADAEQVGRPVVFIEVSALLEAQDATEAEIELSYHTSGASWWPLYDLVLDGEKLTVSYLAEITQRTGEDWPEVALALSTTRRGQQQTLPELSPWYIGRPVPPVPAAPRPRRARGETFRAAAGSPLGFNPESADYPTGEGPAVPMAAVGGAMPAAKVLAAEVGEGESGAGLVYTVARPLAVPGDGGPHKTLVASFEADAVLDYVTVPVLAAEAYLRARVTNGPLLLLPGQGRIFHGAQFTGETYLDTVVPGEEFEVQLGVDDQVKVERKLTRRAASKALIGGTRTIDIGYEITVQNHHDRKATVTVHDHIPVSTDGDIKVRTREATPPPATTTDLGELTWNLTLAPGKPTVIAHRFTVEHPAQVTVTGL
jgi:uncharacterized protein (TIGR02231 family)